MVDYSSRSIRRVLVSNIIRCTFADGRPGATASVDIDIEAADDGFKTAGVSVTVAVAHDAAKSPIRDLERAAIETALAALARLASETPDSLHARMDEDLSQPLMMMSP